MELTKRQFNLGIVATALAAFVGCARDRPDAKRTTATSGVVAPSAHPDVPGAEPFTVRVPDAKLAQIHARVREYKAPRLAENARAESGIDPAFFARLVEHWRDRYDWRAHEREINAFHHYRADVDGQSVHFVLERGSGSKRTPLLLLHGWPYSFYEFLPLVERLAHPERFGGSVDDAFDVVIPSLPGTAYSDAPPKLAGLRAAGVVLDKLMTNVLGYPRYLVQGGDHGDVVGLWMARDNPRHVLGLHENMLAVRDDAAAYGTGVVLGESTEAERAYMLEEKRRFGEQSAYFLLHMTRGETLGAALADSPVGQAAWMAEKFWYWTDKTKKPFESVYDMDTLITNIMLYVVTDSFATSIWPYMAFVREPSEAPNLPIGTKIEVPVAFAALPNDGLQPVAPRSLMARTRTNIVQWTDYPGGGHFPFREQSEVFVDDLRRFARKVAR